MEPTISDKKENIVKAGRQAVARYGYGKTTLSDIATLCGISKTSIYYYFDSKEDLFREILWREGKRFLNLLADHIGRAENPEAAILSYIDARREFSEENPNLSDVTVRTFLEVTPVAFRQLQDIREECIEMIRKQIEAGIDHQLFTKDADAAEIAESIDLISRSIELEEIHNAGVRRFSEVDHKAIAQKTRRIVRLILNGIRK